MRQALEIHPYCIIRCDVSIIEDPIKCQFNKTGSSVIRAHRSWTLGKGFRFRSCQSQALESRLLGDYKGNCAVVRLQNDLTI